MQKLHTIELFAGCGGLLEGFLQQGCYDTLACVEWEKAPCMTLANRLERKWHHLYAKNEVIRFDIQRTDELINGFDDEEYSKHEGLAKLVGSQIVDAIVGGPPCQAYSLAGRIRDEHGMKEDYRNYLFESYMRIVKYFNSMFFCLQAWRINIRNEIMLCPIYHITQNICISHPLGKTWITYTFFLKIES